MPTRVLPTPRFTAATAPGAIPLLGHAPALLHRPHAFVAGLPAHGDLVRLRLGPLDAYVACHPELVRRLLTQDRTYDKGGLVLDKAREVFGEGLATCPAAAHRRQRRLLQPAFHRDRLPGYAALMAEEIAATTAPWRDGDTVDLPAAMYRLATAVTARCLFAAHDRAGSLPLHESADVITRGVGRRVMLPLPGLDRLPTPGNRRFRRARQTLRETTEQLIADYRATGTDHGDLLSVVLGAQDEDGKGLSDAEIHDQVITFLLAGTETTAATLSWAWTLLAANPAVRRRLHAELDTVLDGRPARHEDLPALPLTARIVSETLRLHPPVWLLSRTVTTATELGGHRVPAGATILFSPYLLHRRADLFPCPDRFDPDRWLTTAHPAPGTYTPFGLGARRCIGDTFGTTEAVLAIATIAARWTVTPTPGRPVRPTRSASLTPRPFTATLTRRPR
ncbi:cytochrome P450 [Streptomyces sp. 1331.2]|uniref:cytochrome P450 n=1 Tax=Streptomyces sp. 1331.2 TaxID=1938835 RepID=UPI000BD1203E|nr:cytochrome P450 [Streptomyces sp. 1331.2]SOB79797.1 pentalenene oxygenase [Streptomyces sp. 1331.2]